MRKVLRFPALKSLTGASAPTIWRWIREGKFPAPVKLGDNLSGWLAEEVEEWQQQRIAQRDARREVSHHE
jgi:prophage regulatory protein